jgi:hypothetical protein
MFCPLNMMESGYIHPQNETFQKWLLQVLVFVLFAVISV